MVNSSRKFVLLMIRPILEHVSNVCLVSLLPRQEDDLARSKAKYEVLFSDVIGMSPKRSVEHEIMLTGKSVLSNLGLYQTSIVESDEIK